MLKKIFIILLSGGLAAAAVFGAVKWINRGGAGFCRLPPGIFRAESPDSSLPKALQRFLIFIPIRKTGHVLIFPDAPADKTTALAFTPEDISEQMIAPVSFLMDGVSYELAARHCEDGADGVITEKTGGRSAPLSVRVVTEQSLVGADIPPALAPAFSRRFQLGVRLKDEEAALANLKMEQTKLAALISGSDAFKARLEAKYSNLSVELNQLDRAAQDLRGEIDALEKRVVLAQRLTPKGELTSLSRESLEKDDEWIRLRRESAPSMEAQ